MSAMSSIAVEHELAYRRHELEKAAARDAVVRRRIDRGNTARREDRPTHLSWWRRLVLAH